GRQGGDDVGGVLVAVGFHRHIDVRALGRDIQHRPMVRYVDDVAAVVADRARNIAEHAGPVTDEGADGDHPLVTGEFPAHDRGGEARVDVAAREDETYAAATEAIRVRHDGRQRHSARALCHRLLEHEELGNGALDGGFADEHHV